jgi:glyoxylase-like metal-dependent hydrolase (beta-lactamase superfamily II)
MSKKIFGFSVIALPGHTPGSVGFWNAEKKILIAGDAITTWPLGHWKNALKKTPRLGCPPEAFTLDWYAVRRSLRVMAQLRPTTLLCGHGKPLSSAELAGSLGYFAEHTMIPLKGRYIADPVRYNKTTSAPIIPPVVPDRAVAALKTVALAAFLGGALYWLSRKETI